MELLSIEEIKQQYPDQWVLIKINEEHMVSKLEKGNVLLFSKDYLELCYKASEVAKGFLTTIIYTGMKVKKNRKWLKASILQENL